MSFNLPHRSPGLAPTWIALVAGLAATAALFAVVSGLERRRYAIEFERLAVDRYYAVERSVDAMKNAVHGLRALYQVSSPVDAETFTSFASGQLERYSGIQALEWVPAVPGDRREPFELEAREQGLHVDMNGWQIPFIMLDRAAGDTMVIAAERSLHYPVHRIEPMRGNERALGFDLASSPVRMAALRAASETDEIATTARLDLVQEPESQHSVLWVLPVYRSEADRSVDGYIIGVSRIGDVLSTAMSYLESVEIEVVISDESAPVEERFLAGFDGTIITNRLAANRAEPPFSETIEVGGRIWRVSCTPSADFIAARTTQVALIVLFGGLLITGLTVLYLVKAREIEAKRVKQEEAVRERDAELAHVSRVATVGELGTTLAHELNQPLCAIVANAQAARHLVKAGSDPEEVRSALAAIAAEGKRAGDVIRRLRDFVKTGTVEPSSVQLNDVVREVADMVRVALPRSTELVCETAESLAPVLADRVQLQQVLLNLVRNGAEAMEQVNRGATLTVRTSMDGSNTAVVAVIDHGRGFSPDEAESLFQPFYSTKPDGLGMGLSISRTIIEAHGGHLWATANSDGGATVQFTIPTLR